MMRGRRGATVRTMDAQASLLPIPTHAESIESLESMSQKLEVYGVPRFSDIELQSIKWQDGTRVIELSNRALCYELYFVLRHRELARILDEYRVTPKINPKLKVEADDTTMDWMTSATTQAYLVDFFSKLDRNAHPSTSSILGMFIYATELMAYLADTDGLRAAISTVQGVDPCRQCGSYNTLATTAQTRSADEPETRFVKCLACSASWKEN